MPEFSNCRFGMVKKRTKIINVKDKYELQPFFFVKIP